MIMMVLLCNLTVRARQVGYDRRVRQVITVI